MTQLISVQLIKIQLLTWRPGYNPPNSQLPGGWRCSWFPRVDKYRWWTAINSKKTWGYVTIAVVNINNYSAIVDQSLPASLPETFTMRTLFSHHLDFNAIPRRTFFQYLRNFNSDETEREKLDEFLSKEGAVSILFRYSKSCADVSRMSYMNIAIKLNGRSERSYLNLGSRLYLKITCSMCFHSCGLDSFL